MRFAASCLKERTQVLHGAGGIPVGAIFQHIVKAVMEHDGVIDLAHGLADDTGLTQGNPILESAFDDQRSAATLETA